MSEEKISISTIRRDGGTQARDEMNAEHTDSLRDVLAKGEELPEVVVFFDGKDRWLADGFHTVEAYEKEGKTYITAKVKNGTQRQAILYAVGANETHGLRRTNADKRKAVLMLLGDEEWSKSSDNWIAEQCKVSDFLVSSIRKESTSRNGSSDKTTGKDGKKRKSRRKESQENTKDESGNTTSDRQPGDEKEEDANAPPTVDADGKPVPPQAVIAFEKSAEMEAWGRDVDAIVRRAKEFSEGPAGFLMEYESIRLHFKNGKMTVLQNRPTHVCPMCKGNEEFRNKDDGKKCRCCKGRGWTAAHVHKRLTEEKAKA